jgi:acyl-ACP thioesterase
MKNEPFVITYPVRLNDISVDAKLRSWVVFDYLQDAAGRHADLLGVGLKQLRKSDLSWVLSRIRIQMDDFPEYGDTVKITTWPSGFDRLFAYRQFEITSAETGKRFGVAGSAWLTLNPENFRPVSPQKYLTGLPQWEYDGDVFFQGDTLSKITSPEKTEINMPHKVSSAMVDYNRHLNNAYYAMFTEDWLGMKLDSPVRMTALQLNFNGSTGFGEELVCSGILGENNSFCVSGIHAGTGKNSFLAQGTFETVSPEM